MWTVTIRDQPACSMQSDLKLHCPLKLLLSSTVRKDLTHTMTPFDAPGKQAF